MRDFVDGAVVLGAHVRHRLRHHPFWATSLAHQAGNQVRLYIARASLITDFLIFAVSRWTLYQVGEAFWRAILAEHGLGLDGVYKGPEEIQQRSVYCACSS